MKNKNRLFVPLTSEAFEDFVKRGKQVEIRKVIPNFTAKTVYEGRSVELRKGYSGTSIWGIIGQVVIGDLSTVIYSFPLATVEPRSESYEKAIQENLSLLGEAMLYIGFQVILTNEVE
jgi:hypothetical protein